MKINKIVISLVTFCFLVGGSNVMARSISLTGICPNPLAIQLDWQPESEHGGIYKLVGNGYKIDRDNKRVSGPLMASGKKTGINVEVRIGGPPVGFQPAQALMYADTSIFMGFSRVTELISSYKDLPIVAVMATLDKSPFSIYWDAATYPNVNRISDLKKHNVTIMLGRPDIGWKYFVAKGIMNKSQMDLSDMAKPAAFISANGKLAEAGFATAEPFLYEVEIAEWGKPVKVQLLHDAGFPEYFQALAVKKEDIDKKSECLEKLVPIIQQSHVDYIQNPNKTNELIVKLAKTYLTGWVYSMPAAKFSHRQQLALDIVGNGENYFIGDFNPSRVERLVEIVGFVTDVDVSSLDSREMVTNKFLDPSIGL
jgi:ABC-type nitrate/sulfonate/bicarbonate transport system substrate-binding protein